MLYCTRESLFLQYLLNLTLLFCLQVQPLLVVDNSDISPSCLTVPSDSPYDEETVHATHFKQRGSLWPFICSCSWSASSSLWRCFGVFAGSIFSLPIHKERPSTLQLNFSSSHAPHLTVPPVASPAPTCPLWDLHLRLCALGARSKAAEEPPNA